MDKREIADVLEKAADLIEPEGAWVKGYPARDADGDLVLPYSPRAVCWCAEGAVAAVLRKQWNSGSFDQHPAVLFLRNRGVRWEWNDSSRRTQAEVVAKLRQAAALAREQSK